MPRDSGTGVATPPSGTTLVANTDIQSAPLNSIHSDIYAIFNAPIPAGLLPSLSFLPLAGGIMTGPVVLSADATASLNPVTLQQYTTGLAGKAAVSHTHTSADITNFNAASDTRIALQTIAGHSDTVVASLLNNDVLTWESATSKWKNKPRTQFIELNAGSFVNNTKIAINHGLSAVPARVDWYLKCKTASTGYSVGDYAYAAITGAPNSSVWFNVTQVGLSPRLGSGLSLVHKDNLDDSFSNAAWDVVFRVFA